MAKKAVFITGASRGIGQATAKNFSQEGWLIAGFYKIAPGPKIKNCIYYQLDVSQKNSIQKACALAFKGYGRIDCLVNNAGMSAHKKGLTEYDETTMDQ